MPDAALVFNAGGLQVATVDAESRVRFQKVTIYRDFGTTAELRDGLRGGESLVLSPPADLAEGSKVQMASPLPTPDTGRQNRAPLTGTAAIHRVWPQKG